MKKILLLVVLSFKIVACNQSKSFKHDNRDNNSTLKEDANLSNSQYVTGGSLQDLKSYIEQKDLINNCLNSENLLTDETTLMKSFSSISAFYSSHDNSYPQIPINMNGIANIEKNASKANYYQFGISFNTPVKLNFLVERNCPAEIGLTSSAFTGGAVSNEKSISFSSVLIDVYKDPLYQSCTYRLMYNWLSEDNSNTEIQRFNSGEDTGVDLYVGDKSCTKIVTVKFN